MALQNGREYTRLTEREIAGTGLGTSPASVAAFRDIQRAAFDDNPGNTAAAQEAASAAQSSANSAQSAADSAAENASAAQNRADEAYALADTKVQKSVGPAWAVPSGSASRLSFATYTAPTISATPTQTEVQAIADALQSYSRALKAVVDDLRANRALTP